jgi:hypothetical protein
MVATKSEALRYGGTRSRESIYLCYTSDDLLVDAIVR